MHAILPPSGSTRAHGQTRPMCRVPAPQVYRNDSGRAATSGPGQERSATAHPTGFHLAFRENGRSPVTMWEPVPPEGYAALGTLVEGAPQQPEPAEVLCVRRDLTASTRAYDAPAWRWDPPALQVRPVMAAPHAVRASGSPEGQMRREEKGALQHWEVLRQLTLKKHCPGA